MSFIVNGDVVLRVHRELESARDGFVALRGQPLVKGKALDTLHSLQQRVVGTLELMPLGTPLRALLGSDEGLPDIQRWRVMIEALDRDCTAKLRHWARGRALLDNGCVCYLTDEGAEPALLEHSIAAVDFLLQSKELADGNDKPRKKRRTGGGSRSRHASGPKPLTDKQKRVLELHAQGGGVREIADMLGIERQSADELLKRAILRAKQIQAEVDRAGRGTGCSARPTSSRDAWDDPSDLDSMVDD